MAAPKTLTNLLESLTQSLSSTLEAAPKVAAIEPPKDGVTLLEVKNDILLSYVQNLVFLILLKLRNAKAAGGDAEPDFTEMFDGVTNKLVELRLYLERGVRPLEEKLRFSLENMMRAADDAERKRLGLSKTDGDDDESDSEEESESGEDDDEDDEDSADKLRGPQLSRFIPDRRHAENTKDKTGVYRPPQTRRVVMPESEPREKRERMPRKSAAVDEYVASELAAGPLAEPSVGTTILDRGRKVKTDTDRKKDLERQEYEERNFLRLPKESKKERAKQAKIAGRRGGMEFGGEEWRDLGDGADRINQLTRRKNAPTGTRALLEKSRKRQHDSTDGPRQSGAQVEMGDRYTKRLKALEGGRRDRGGNRK